MNKVIKFIITNKLCWPILILGFFVNLCFYLPIRNSMGHDVFWHLALIRTAFSSIPFGMPIFSGAPLQGYNWLLDFLMYLVSKTGFTPVLIYAVIFPLFYFTAVTVLTIIYGLKSRRSVAFINSLLFFILLATPFAYFLSFYKRGSILFGFHYPTAMQSVSALTNPQYAATVLLLLIVLIILKNKVLTVKHKTVIYLSIFLSFGFKFYGGVVLSFLILTNNIIDLIRNRNPAEFIKSSAFLIISVAASVLIFYDPLSSSGSGSIFIWSPLSLVHPIIEDPDAIYMPTLVNARYFLYENNIWSPRLWLIELFTIALYFIYNAGTRIIGVVFLAKTVWRKKIDKLNFIIILTAFFSFMLTITLIQKGEWWNTVQFFGYGLFLLNFIAAESIDQIFKIRSRLKYILIVITIILTLPLSIELIYRQYQRFQAPDEISTTEQQALFFLSNQPKGTVLNLPLINSAYITALSGQKVYYADEQVLKNLGIDYQFRKKELQDINLLNPSNLKVQYLYLKKNDPVYEIILDKIRVAKSHRIIFENTGIAIFSKR